MNEASQTNPLRTRLLGLFMVLCAALLSYTSIYRTLEKAWQHAGTITFSTKAVVLIPISGALGLALFLFPQTQPMLWNDGKRLTTLGWVLVLVFAGAGFALQYYFEQQLRALGYTI